MLLCVSAFLARASSRTAWSRTRRHATGSAALLTKPDQVQNGVAQYPVCGGAFFAPGIEPTAGYSFMSVLTHTTGRLGVGPRANVCGFNSETWNGAATVWDQPIDWPTTPDDRGSAQFHVEHFLGSALLGHLGLPLLDHEAELRVADWNARCRSLISRTRRSATSSYNDATPNANPDLVPDKANATFLTRCTVPARSGRHVIYAEWGRTPPTFERFHGCIDAQFSGTPPPTVTANIALNPNVTTFTGSGSIALNGSDIGRQQPQRTRGAWPRRIRRCTPSRIR